MRRRGGWTAVLAMLALAWSQIAGASETPPGDGAADGRTPPRLSYTSGQVSYWRPGAPDWVGAPLNVPLAGGDELYTGPDGTLEIQIGPRAWVRAWAASALGVVSHEPDYLGLKLTTGHAALDVRALEPGHTLELSTPNAAFTIERPGYYRVTVTAERTSFVARRGGSALATPRSGQAIPVGAAQELAVEGGEGAAARLAAAPDLDTWDRWNYARTDALSASASARHLSPGIYGAADLDHHGSWEVVETYGTIWVPRGVPAGWAPYTTGAWISDPYYGWTWVDTAPWGWAPYHYGRWVHVRGFWAWAPGPIIVRPVYAPALVAFFSGPGITVSIGRPAIGWCALGWGEPIVPWWGRPGFAGVPSWRGWGGPRVVNNVVVHSPTVVNVTNITVYNNSRVKGALVAVQQDHFGGQRVADHRLRPGDVRHIEPTQPPVAATPASLVPATAGLAPVKPARDVIGRPVFTRQGEPVPGGVAARGGRTEPVGAPPGASGAAKPGPQQPPSAAAPIPTMPRSPEPVAPAVKPGVQPGAPHPTPGRPSPRPTEPLPTATRAPAPAAPVVAPRPAGPGPADQPAASPARQPRGTAPSVEPRRTEPRQLGAVPAPPPPAAPAPASPPARTGAPRGPDGTGPSDRSTARQPLGSLEPGRTVGATPGPGITVPQPPRVTPPEPPRQVAPASPPATRPAPPRVAPPETPRQVAPAGPPATRPAPPRVAPLEPPRQVAPAGQPATRPAREPQRPVAAQPSLQSPGRPGPPATPAPRDQVKQQRPDSEPADRGKPVTR